MDDKLPLRSSSLALKRGQSILLVNKKYW